VSATGLVYAVTAVDAVACGLLLLCVAAGLTLASDVGGVLNLAHGMHYLAGAYTAWLIFDGSLPSPASGVAAGVGVDVPGGAGPVVIDVLAIPAGLSKAAPTAGRAS
jgi:branched-subunit amino acid ABC-type transport system permease component